MLIFLNRVRSRTGRQQWFSSDLCLIFIYSWTSMLIHIFIQLSARYSCLLMTLRRGTRMLLKENLDNLRMRGECRRHWIAPKSFFIRKVLQIGRDKDMTPASQTKMFYNPSMKRSNVAFLSRVISLVSVVAISEWSQKQNNNCIKNGGIGVIHVAHMTPVRWSPNVCGPKVCTEKCRRRHSKHLYVKMIFQGLVSQREEM